MKADAMILHPLPRTVELDKSVDADPRAMYFRQAMNGLYVRMALLTMLLDKEPSVGECVVARKLRRAYTRSRSSTTAWAPSRENHNALIEEQLRRQRLTRCSICIQRRAV